LTLEIYPAVDPTLPKVIDQRDTSGRTLTWWRASDYFVHPYVVAPLALFPSHNLRGKMRAGPEIRFLLDTTGRGFEPEDRVAEWVEQNAGPADFGVDYPPRKLSWVVPVRGESLPSMEEEMRARSGSPRAGIAVYPDGKLSTLLYGFILHREFFRGKRLHVVGVSGHAMLQALAVYSRTVEGTISFDTSCHLSGATMGAYFHPYTVRALVSRGTTVETPPCDCAVCQTPAARIGEQLTPPALVLHNLYQLLRYVRIWRAVAISHPDRGSYLINEVQSVLDGFNYYKEHGYAHIRDTADLLQRFDPGQRRLLDVQSVAPVPCSTCGAESRTEYRGTRVCDSCKRFYEEAEKVLAE
jgi:hypothetical protein